MQSHNIISATVFFIPEGGGTDGCPLRGGSLERLAQAEQGLPDAKAAAEEKELAVIQKKTRAVRTWKKFKLNLSHPYGIMQAGSVVSVGCFIEGEMLGKEAGHTKIHHTALYRHLVRDDGNCGGSVSVETPRAAL